MMMMMIINRLVISKRLRSVSWLQRKRSSVQRSKFRRKTGNNCADDWYDTETRQCRTSGGSDDNIAASSVHFRSARAAIAVDTSLDFRFNDRSRRRASRGRRSAAANCFRFTAATTWPIQTGSSYVTAIGMTTRSLRIGNMVLDEITWPT